MQTAKVILVYKIHNFRKFQKIEHVVLKRRYPKQLMGELRIFSPDLSIFSPLVPCLVVIQGLCIYVCLLLISFYYTIKVFLCELLLALTSYQSFHTTFLWMIQYGLHLYSLLNIFTDVFLPWSWNYKTNWNMIWDVSFENGRFNPFLPNVPFWSPWKHQKTKGFLMFLGGSKG